MTKSGFTTRFGGTIAVEGRRLEVLTAQTVDEKIIWLCPACGGDWLIELADFVQFGLITDLHDIVWRCKRCEWLFVAEFEVSI